MMLNRGISRPCGVLVHLQQVVSCLTCTIAPIAQTNLELEKEVKRSMNDLSLEDDLEELRRVL